MSPAHILLCLIVVLTGCATPYGGSSATWSWPWSGARGVLAPANAGHAYASGGVPAGDPQSPFGFDWQLSGDPEVMPVQVFDDGQRMWLQFPTDGAWPAVFAMMPGGVRPLPYRREGPYMVLEGVHSWLDLRGGHLQGQIRRFRNHSRGTDTPVSPAALAGAHSGAVVAHNMNMQTAPPSTPAVPPGTATQSSPPIVPGTDATLGDSLPNVTVQASMADTPLGLSVGSQTVPTQKSFAVSPSDSTMRQALERWASTVGWTFSAEHWSVDVDIPLVGQASFDSDFKSAVRELLAATEMGERPLQPCFYSNRVLRVVAFAQSCDRKQGMGIMS